MKKRRLIMGMLLLGSLVSCDFFGLSSMTRYSDWPSFNNHPNDSLTSGKESSSPSLSSYGSVDDLIRDEYTYNEEYGWYEKIIEDKNNSYVTSYTAIFNLTMSYKRSSIRYVIPSYYSKVSFITNSNETYEGKISAQERATNLTIEVYDLNLEGYYSTPFDVSQVSSDYKVTISIFGESSFKGGLGSSGNSGTFYDTDNKKTSGTSRSGGNGSSGSRGEHGIDGNNIEVIINQHAKVSLFAGKGGSGGYGGDGEAGAGSGIGTSGHGGKGGEGGRGGNGIHSSKNLSIYNYGTLNITGGDGGSGGYGGDGGNNQDDGTFERAEHGGNGGNGGRGGDGNYAIYVESKNEINLFGNTITLTGGSGGNGGRGGDGGNSCRNFFQTSNGGNPGNAGSGGDGGNGVSGCAFEVKNTKIKNYYGAGGKGGSHGSPGYNSSIGYGSSGSNGKNGTSLGKDDD